MVFFGTKTKETARIPLSLHCPKCGERQCLDLFILTQTFTIYTFAAFPLETKGIVGCNACEATFVQSEMTPQMAEQVAVLINRQPTPWLKYLPGIAILIIVLLSMIMMFT